MSNYEKMSFYQAYRWMESNRNRCVVSENTGLELKMGECGTLKSRDNFEFSSIPISDTISFWTAMKDNHAKAEQVEKTLEMLRDVKYGYIKKKDVPVVADAIEQLEKYKELLTKKEEV